MTRRLLMGLSIAMALAAPARAAQSERRDDRSPKRRAFALLREIYKTEPSIQDVQRAALRFYKLEPERIAGMMSAARLKGLVPEVEAGLDNSISRSYTNVKDGLYPI